MFVNIYDNCMVKCPQITTLATKSSHTIVAMRDLFSCIQLWRA